MPVVVESCGSTALYFVASCCGKVTVRTGQPQFPIWIWQLPFNARNPSSSFMKSRKSGLLFSWRVKSPETQLTSQWYMWEDGGTQIYWHLSLGLFLWETVLFMKKICFVKEKMEGKKCLWVWGWEVLVPPRGNQGEIPTCWYRVGGKQEERTDWDNDAWKLLQGHVLGCDAPCNCPKHLIDDSNTNKIFHCWRWV